MKKVWVIMTAILGLALVAVIVYCVNISKDRDALNAELKSVQTVLASTQTELTSTKQTLTSTSAELISTKQTLSSTQARITSTQTELTSTKQTLTSTQTELTSTKQTLSSTQTELTSTKQTLSSTQARITSIEAELTATKKTLATAQDTLRGLGITLSTSKACYDVDLVDNPDATNPTWSQLMAFLSTDHTEQHAYIADIYDCSQFSRDIHNNAEAAGIRTAEVQASFLNQSIGHALNAFLTTDYGLVYVDCTEAPDKVARVKAGKQLRAVQATTMIAKNIRNDSWWDSLSYYYYIPPDSSITNIRIYW